MRYILSIVLVLWTTQSLALEWKAVQLATLKGVTEIELDARSGKIVAHAEAGSFAYAEGGFSTATEVASPVVPPPGDIIPHGTVVTGKNVVAQAWLIQPTRRYDHEVLGDEVEAGALKIRHRDGREMIYELGDQYVFEDLTPRLADMDGDGLDEVILARSSLSEGAAVSVYKVGKRRLEQFAVSPSVGLAYRWLNPIGAADFDSDGEMDIAVVETPHLGKSLVIYGRDASKLQELGRLQGFSTHVSGSTIIAMSLVIDINKDGIFDIVLPNEDRTALKAMTFRGAKFLELASGPAGAPIVTNLLHADVDGDGVADIIYGRKDGVVEAILR